MRRLAILLAVVALAGCAGATSRPWDADWNPQQYAGLTVVEVEWCEDKAGGKFLCKAKWFDGKEKQGVTLNIDLNGRTLDYSASDVAAFPAFETRGDVEKWVAEKFAGAASDIIPKVINLVSKAYGLP